MLMQLSKRSQHMITFTLAMASCSLARSLGLAAVTFAVEDLPSAIAVFDRLKLGGGFVRPQLYNCYMEACGQ